jgi:hypothetical protein
MSIFARTLFAVLPAWRPLRNRGLPFWMFLGPYARLARVEALRADARCTACDWQARCRKRVARGATRPPHGCPNAEHFA